MKKFLFFITLFFCFQSHADYSCKSYALARKNGKSAKSFTGYSDHSKKVACRRARRDCELQILRLDSTMTHFCYPRSTSNAGYDGRYKPAIVYKNGSKIKSFGIFCYGSSYDEAKDFCEMKMEKQCRRYINKVSGVYSEDYYCRFL